MREIVQNELTYFEVGVTDASGKLRTGLVVDYEIHKCSDNSLLVSGTANEIGITGVYSFSYTFTDIEEYRLHWITPLTYDDGFENIIVHGVIDISAGLIAYDVAKVSDISGLWTTILDGTYTTQDLFKIIVSILAGKTTIVNNGGGQATVTFRNLDDTVNRIVVDMTGSERTDINFNL